MKPNLSLERGQALILISLAAVALVAIVALAVDGSAKFSDRRHAQNAADASALAASLFKANGTAADQDDVCSTASGWSNSAFCVDLINVAWDRATENGYDGLIPNSVDVYSPPISGPYATANGRLYVQVVVTSYVDTFFARIIGITQTRNIVTAVALAGTGGSIANGASVVSMNPNPNCGSGSFNVGGNGEIHLSGGGMFVNSSASCGYSQTSCSVILDVSDPSIGITSAGSAILQSCGDPLNTYTAPQIIVPDEVVYPDVPAECGMTAATPTNPAGNDWVIHPGYYTDFPQAGLIGNNKDIEMDPGVYCVNGDLSWSGSTFASLDGSNGVTIYIRAGHDFRFNINSPIVLNPSNSGDYQGYLIILEGNQNTHPACVINGGSYLDINGTIFAPYCDITINGDNSTQSTFNAQFIGWDVTLNGGNVINIHYDPDENGKVKRRVGLMQ